MGVMNFESKKTNNRARAFGMKAMKQLQDDEENSGSGSGMFWADLAWFCDYLLYDVCDGDEIVTWSTLTGTRNSPATSPPQDLDIMPDRVITPATISPDLA